MLSSSIFAGSASRLAFVQLWRCSLSSSSVLAYRAVQNVFCFLPTYATSGVQCQGELLRLRPVVVRESWSSGANPISPCMGISIPCSSTTAALRALFKANMASRAEKTGIGKSRPRMKCCLSELRRLQQPGHRSLYLQQSGCPTHVQTVDSLVEKTRPQIRCQIVCKSSIVTPDVQV